jgi:hypothetical protein
MVLMQTKSIKKQKSIHIGINYQGTASELNGCVSDAINMLGASVLLKSTDITLAVDIDIYDYDLLATKTCRDSRITFLKNADKVKQIYPTKQNILKEIHDSVSNPNIGSLFITYSGHGASGKPSLENKEELDYRDEYFCTLNEQSRFDGTYESFISDDELLETINRGAGSRTDPIVITYVFDCCHSGTIFDLPYTMNLINGLVTFSSQPVAKLAKSTIHKNAIISGWSGCQDVQSSYENYNSQTSMVEGVCSRSFIKVVEDLYNNNNNEVTMFDMHNRIIEHIFEIDNFNDTDVNTSNKYQVANFSSSFNIGLTSDDLNVISQKFILGNVDKCQDIRMLHDIAVLVPRENYPELVIIDLCKIQSDDWDTVIVAVDPVDVDADPDPVDPVDADPVDPDPVDADPDPVDPDPVDPDPVDAYPVDADPVDADPVDADPVDADPVDADLQIALQTVMQALAQDIVKATMKTLREMRKKNCN